MPPASGRYLTPPPSPPPHARLSAFTGGSEPWSGLAERATGRRGGLRVCCVLGLRRWTSRPARCGNADGRFSTSVAAALEHVDLRRGGSPGTRAAGTKFAALPLRAAPHTSYRNHPTPRRWGSDSTPSLNARVDPGKSAALLGAPCDVAVQAEGDRGAAAQRSIGGSAVWVGTAPPHPRRRPPSGLHRHRGTSRGTTPPSQRTPPV